MPYPYPWKPGEHMAVIGQTGSGKTAVISLLLRQWPYTISLKSKADTTPLPGHRIRIAEGIEDTRFNQFVLDPKYEHQRLEFARLFERVWKSGHWLVNIDEMFALDNQLKLTWFIERQLTQGRSNGLTTIMGLQRPKRISRFALTQATHYIVFAQNGDDLKVVLDETDPALKPLLLSLGKHEFVWYHKPSRGAWKGDLISLAKLIRQQAETSNVKGVTV